jgi:hypothetical protein
VILSLVRELFKAHIEQLDEDPHVLGLPGQIDRKTPPLFQDLPKILTMKQSQFEEPLRRPEPVFVAKSANTTYVGELLVQCIGDAKNQRENVLHSVTHLIDLAAQQFPFNDLCSIVPGLSRFQC